jgi:hypothetical protein
VRAATITNGEAVCVRHFAKLAAAANPSMGEPEILDRVSRAFGKPDRSDEQGYPLNPYTE